CVVSLPFLCSCFFHFSFYSAGPHRHLHSFPTRRSSDLSLVWLDEEGDCRHPARTCLNLSSKRARRETRKSPMIRHWLVPTIKRRSEEHTSELQSRGHLVCRLLLEKKKKKKTIKIQNKKQ